MNLQKRYANMRIKRRDNGAEHPVTTRLSIRGVHSTKVLKLNHKTGIINHISEFLQHWDLSNNLSLNSLFLVSFVHQCWLFIKYWIYMIFLNHVHFMRNKIVSGYICNHSSLRIGNETLRPLEGAMGTPSAWPVSEAWIKTHNALDIGRWKPMT